MRRKMIDIVIIAAITIAASICFAAEVDLPGADETVSWRISESTPTRTKIEFRLGQIDISDISIQGHDFDAISCEGLARTSKIGAPELPVLSILLACGEGDVHATFENIRTTRIEDVLPMPAQPPSPDIHGWIPPPISIDKTIYSSSKSYPAERFSAGNRIVIHGAEGRRIGIFPIRYLPSENSIEVTYRFTLIIEHNPPAPVPSRLATPAFARFNKNAFANPDVIACSNNRPRPTSSSGAEMLIITTPAMSEPAESLAYWRRLSGIDTEVKTTSETGTSSSSIQSYIQTAYDTWSPAPEFLLIIGDAENIPPTYSSDDHPYHGTPTGTDLYYATVDGPDYYPDIFYGRMSVQSESQAWDVVRKVIDYEKVSFELGDSFYIKAACATYFQDSDGNGYADRRFAQTSEEIRDHLLSHERYVSRLYYANSTVDPTNWNNGSFGDGSPIPTELLRSSGFTWDANSYDVINAIDNGVFLLSHRDHGYRGGWGEPGFSQTNVQVLSNGHKLPVVMSFNCLSGYFDNETDAASDGTGDGSECFCESFQRKSPGGAVGLIGSSRVSYSGLNDYMALGFIDGIWGDLDATHTPVHPTDFRCSPALEWGKLYMEEMWSHSKLEFEIFHWFGDPAMRIFTDVPVEMSVATPSNMSVGTSALDIDCDTDGAMVCLVIGGEILARGSVAAGSAHLDFVPITMPDTAIIGVTNHNAVPVIRKIPVLFGGHITMTPDTIDVLMPATIHFDVLDILDAPYPGVKIYITGFAANDTIVVGSSGVVDYPITPPYAENIRVVAERPEGGIIFNSKIVVVGGAEFIPTDIEVASPDVRIVDSLAVGVDGYIRADLPSSPFFWKVFGEGIETFSGDVTSGDTFRIEIVPFAECDVIIETAKEGYAVGRSIVLARVCYGRLDGTVKDSSGSFNAENIEIFVYPEDADTSIEDPSYIILTNFSGNFYAGNFVPCATYDLYPHGFGWKPTMFELVHHSEGDYDIRLSRALTSPLSGNVSDTSGASVQAEIVLLHPNGTQLRRTSSGATGNYSVSAIPYFDYKIAAFARGYRNYLADCPINIAPTTFDITMTPVEYNILLISNGSVAAAESLVSHIESFGLTVEEIDHVPTLDSLAMFEFVIYSTGENSAGSVIDIEGAWRLLEGHRNGIKILFEGGDLARRYIEASSMPLVITDSLLMIANYSGDDPDTSVKLVVSPPEAYILAHNPGTLPREISTRDPGTSTAYFDMVTPPSGSAHLLFTKTGSPIKGIASYYADSMGAGVHRMGYMFFRYDNALLDPGANKRILENFVEWFRAPDFDHGILMGRAVVISGNPENIVVTGGGGVDTTDEDGRFTLHADPGPFTVTFSAPHITDTTHYGLNLAPGQIQTNYVAILSVSEPVKEKELPAEFEILAARPNPFNGVVSFDIRTPCAADVEIAIYDIVGKIVHKRSEIVDGQSTILWDTRENGELSSGIYLYRISSGQTAFDGKIVLAK